MKKTVSCVFSLLECPSFRVAREASSRRQTRGRVAKPRELKENPGGKKTIKDRRKCSFLSGPSLSLTRNYTMVYREKKVFQMVWLPSHCFRYTDLTSHQNALCNDSSRHVSSCRLIGYLKRVILIQKKKATETAKALSKYLKIANVIDRVGPIQKFYTLFFFKSCYYGRPCFNYLNSTMRIYGSG